MKARYVAGIITAGYLLCGLIDPADGADWRPSYYSIDLTHVSHASQHFGSHPTNYGYGALSLAAHWDRAHWALSVAEGVVIEPCHSYAGHHECGGLYGPREVFTATLSYKFGYSSGGVK
jgi:hypothetical protein